MPENEDQIPLESPSPERALVLSERRIDAIVAILPSAGGVSTPPFVPRSTAPKDAAVETATRPTDVEIRIGRIEVRAEFTSAPRREPPKSRPPQVSLDQYLEGRR